MMMRKIGMAAATLLITVSAPSLALGVGDLAKVVLNNGSILTKGQQKCGSALGLSPLDLLQISSARSSVQKLLSGSDFSALDTASNAAADTAAQSPTFCQDTVVKKKGLLGKIANAAKGLVGKRLGL
jgi:hypothetical protein